MLHTHIGSVLCPGNTPPVLLGSAPMHFVQVQLSQGTLPATVSSLMVLEDSTVSSLSDFLGLSGKEPEE